MAAAGRPALFGPILKGVVFRQAEVGAAQHADGVELVAVQNGERRARLFIGQAEKLADAVEPVDQRVAVDAEDACGRLLVVQRQAVHLQGAEIFRLEFYPIVSSGSSTSNPLAFM